MRSSGLLVLLALASLWWFAIAAYAELPERFPVHFDLHGAPDRWTDTSAASWFLLPALGTALPLLLAFLVPAWMDRLAARNSPWLNVPDRQHFRALPEEARLRAVRPMRTMLRILALEMAALCLLLLLGTQKIATGAWTALPPLPTWIAIGVLVATALAGIVHGWRTVRRVIAEHAAA